VQYAEKGFENKPKFRGGGGVILLMDTIWVIKRIVTFSSP